LYTIVYNFVKEKLIFFEKIFLGGKIMFYERLQLLAKEANKSFNQIERELNYPRNALNAYKAGKSPSAKRTAEIAEYFGVTSDYLLGNTSARTLDLADLDNDIVASNLSYSGKPLSENDRQALNNILKEYFESQESE
jgi:transcriptional regulator with XRE-family HTH domain